MKAEQQGTYSPSKQESAKGPGGKPKPTDPGENPTHFKVKTKDGSSLYLALSSGTVVMDSSAALAISFHYAVRSQCRWGPEAAYSYLKPLPAAYDVGTHSSAFTWRWDAVSGGGNKLVYNDGSTDWFVARSGTDVTLTTTSSNAVVWEDEYP